METNTYSFSEVLMKLIVVKSPKLLTKLFRIIFKISKEDMAAEE